MVVLRVFLLKISVDLQRTYVQPLVDWLPSTGTRTHRYRIDLFENEITCFKYGGFPPGMAFGLFLSAICPTENAALQAAVAAFYPTILLSGK